MKSHKKLHMAVSIDHKDSNNDNSSYAMVAKSGEKMHNHITWIPGLAHSKMENLKKVLKIKSP